MSEFSVKQIIPTKEIGKELGRLREARGWTLQKASRETKLLISYIEAIEDDRFHDLPEEPARSNFIKRYLKALGGDPNLELAIRTRLISETPSTRAKRLPPPRVRLAVTPQHVKLALLGLVLVMLVGYLGFEIRALRTPPLLEIATPNDGLLTESPSIVVRGSTEPRARITINNEFVPKDTDGNFNTAIDLATGTNIITIEATRKHSKPRILYRTVIFDANPHISLNHY